ncbi:MAG: hypothetical protein GF308_16730 [Candidatus Heimdallarchaeota archaeon]|nr:hypothetical protein [Candidatus Heimdallarchaeota archaeon]
MTELTNKQKADIKSMVEKQQKAKISWIAAIIQLPEEIIRDNTDELGLVLQGEFLLDPKQFDSNKSTSCTIKEVTPTTKEESTKERSIRATDHGLLNNISLFIGVICFVSIPISIFLFVYVIRYFEGLFLIIAYGIFLIVCNIFSIIGLVLGIKVFRNLKHKLGSILNLINLLFFILILVTYIILLFFPSFYLRLFS